MTKNSRREHLLSLKDEKRTMIFYEAPHKLGATLRDMYENFGDRNIAIVRGITKIHEEIIRTTFSEAVRLYGDGGLKGEIVLIIDGKKEEKKEVSLEDAVAIALSKMEEGFSKNDSAKFAAKQTGLKKGDIYSRLMEV